MVIKTIKPLSLCISRGIHRIINGRLITYRAIYTVTTIVTTITTTVIIIIIIIINTTYIITVIIVVVTITSTIKDKR